MKKSILTRILCLLLVVAMLPLSAISAGAAGWTSNYGGNRKYDITLSFDAYGGTAYTNLDGGGDGTVSRGKSVEFFAIPEPYVWLVGWYDKDTGDLLSNELHLKLDNVRRDYNIEARFGDMSCLGYHVDADGHSRHRAGSGCLGYGGIDCYGHSAFTKWTDATSLPTQAGNYYLATDVTLSTFWEAPSGVVLCLNGHIINNEGAGGAITVPEYHQVMITDCDYDTQHYFDMNGIGEWILNDANTDSPYSVTGGVITGAKRGVYIADQGCLYMCGGNIVGVSGDQDGPGVSISDGGLFYMYGGSIQGNVNTYTGLDGDDDDAITEGVQPYDGGGGLFVDQGASAYLFGDSLIANNTALYTNNGGGVYNYRGTVYLAESVRIRDNRGENGSSSNYQEYDHPESQLKIYWDLNDGLADPEIGVSMSANGAFTPGNNSTNAQYFKTDDANKVITVDASGAVAVADASADGVLVTAGTRGAGTTTVNGIDGARGVWVAQNAMATLVAAPLNADYVFIGWYDANGNLITSNATYTVKAAKAISVQAYFAMKEQKTESEDGIKAGGTHQLFNSGDDTDLTESSGWFIRTYVSDTYRYKNTAFSTFDNGGQYLYFQYGGNQTQYDREGPVGVPFTISGKVLEKSIVTMNCYDVDESSGERDYVYLRDLTTNTEVRLGYLTGRNQQWNTTSFTVDANQLKEGHTYQLYLKCEVSGWVAWIDTASITIGAMEEEEEVVVPPVTDASVSASINASRNVTAVLNVTSSEAQTFHVEFKATHIATEDQVGSLFTTIDATPEGVSQTYTFQLESGAPQGAYRIDAYILDADGNVVKTVSCTAGYAKSAVTYHANGGTNNLPEDTNAYNSGDRVTVKFDYIPTLRTRASSNATFLGWSTDPSATEPEYTADGNKTFTIGAEDVTLYAVYHVHTEPDAEDFRIENTTAPSCTQDGSHDEVYYCSDCGEELSRFTVTDPATGHTMGQWVIDTPATDDTDGSQHQSCTKCGYTVTEVIPKNGHTYTTVITPPTCTEQGYTTYTCQNEDCGDTFDADYVDALGHTAEIIPAKEATCTETGLAEGSKCSVCGEILMEQQVTDALGHHYLATVVPVTCTADGYTIFTCTVCGDTYTDNYVATEGHKYDEETVLPTCTEWGYTQSVCRVCGDTHKENNAEPTGHSWGEVVEDTPSTCAAAGTGHMECANCEEILSVALALADHEYEIAETADATCETTGSVTYQCTGCDDSFAEEIPATGHTVEAVPGTPATCTETGLTAGEKCSVCGKILTEQEVLDALGHTEEIIPGKAPTCTETGLTEGKNCSVCGEIIVPQEVIDALGHDYVGVYTAPTFEADGYTTYTCTRCGDSYIVTDDGTKLIAVARIGDTKFTTLHAANEAAVDGDEIVLLANVELTESVVVTKEITLNFNGKTITNTADLWKSGENGDNYAMIVVKDGDLTITGDGTLDAKQDDCYAIDVIGGKLTIENGSFIGNVSAVNVDLGEVIINGGYFAQKQNGYGDKYVLNCKDTAYNSGEADIIVTGGEFKGYNPYNGTSEGANTNFVVDGKHALDADNDGIYTVEPHSYTAVVTAPTCTEKGYTTYTCACGDSYITDETDALGHTEEIIPGKAPTCTETGLTEGSKCSVCGEILTEQQVIDATGHTYTAVVTAPTCTEGGYTTYTCDCGDSYIADETAPLAHGTLIYTDNGDDTHDAVCNNCGEVVVDNEAHTYADGTCTCGATEIDYALYIDYTAFNSQSYIGSQFRVEATGAKRYDSVYITITHNGVEKKITENIGGSTMTVFEYPLAAKEIADVLTVTVYGIKNGVTYTGRTITWSGDQKALEMLEKYNVAGASDLDMKRAVLVANLLKYGAEAQIRFEYNTENLATNVIAGTMHEELIKTTRHDFVDNSSISNNGIEDGSALYYKAVAFHTSVEMQLVFNLPTADATKYEVRFTYLKDGVETTEKIDGSEMTAYNAAYPTYWIVVFDDLAAKELRTMVDVVVYEKETNTAITETYTLSIESIAKGMIDKNNKSTELLYRMMNFGLAAEERYS